MRMNKKVMVKVGFVLFLMAFSATVDARFDAAFLPQVMMEENGDPIPSFFTKSTTSACCNKCSCTRSRIPQCTCADVRETCHSACKHCLCTRSIPPKCWCADVTPFCYDACSSGAQTH